MKDKELYFKKPPEASLIPLGLPPAPRAVETRHAEEVARALFQQLGSNVVTESREIRPGIYEHSISFVTERFIRRPSHDRRISRGDDFAGDAYFDRERNEIVYVAVGYNPNKGER